MLYYTYKMNGYWCCIYKYDNTIQGRGLLEEDSIISLKYKLGDSSVSEEIYIKIKEKYNLVFPDYYF